MGNKLNYSDVKETIEKAGWTLVSTSYVNLKADLQITCPEGHDVFTSFEKFRRAIPECPICKKNNLYKQDAKIPKKQGYRILAFDQASITSGWSVFDGTQLIKFGKWTSQGTHSTERIAKTKYWFISMIQNYQPDKVVLEDIQLQRFEDGGEAVITFKKLAHLQGVLKNYLYEEGIPYKVVPPATWRAHSKIKGRSRTDQKRNAQMKIKATYDVSVTTDEADAILIGAWAAHDHLKNEMVDF